MSAEPSSYPTLPARRQKRVYKPRLPGKEWVWEAIARSGTLTLVKGVDFGEDYITERVGISVWMAADNLGLRCAYRQSADKRSVTCWIWRPEDEPPQLPPILADRPGRVSWKYRLLNHVGKPGPLVLRLGVDFTEEYMLRDAGGNASSAASTYGLRVETRTTTDAISIWVWRRGDDPPTGIPPNPHRVTPKQERFLEAARTREPIVLRCGEDFARDYPKWRIQSGVSITAKPLGLSYTTRTNREGDVWIWVWRPEDGRPEGIPQFTGRLPVWSTLAEAEVTT
jgi:hypothetical protein